MKHYYKLLIISFIVLFSSVNFSQTSPKFILHRPIGLPFYWCIAIDKNGTIWAGSNDHGLFEYKNNIWTNYNNHDDILDLTFDQNDKVWFAEGFNIATIFNSQIILTNGPSLIINNIVTNSFYLSIIFDINGDVWTGGNFSKLIKYEGTNWTIIDSVNNLPIERVRSFVKDSKGNIYFAGISKPNPNLIGEYYSILYMYDGQNFNALTTQPSESPSILLHPISVDKNDHIWFGNRLDYLVEYDGQNFSYYIPPSNMLLGNIEAVTVDNLDQKWVAADSGLFTINY